MADVKPTEYQSLAYSPEIVDLYRSLVNFQTRMIDHVAAGKDATDVKKRAEILRSQLNRWAQSLGSESTANRGFGDCVKGQVFDPILGRCVDQIQDKTA